MAEKSKLSGAGARTASWYDPGMTESDYAAIGRACMRRQEAETKLGCLKERADEQADRLFQLGELLQRAAEGKAGRVARTDDGFVVVSKSGEPRLVRYPAAEELEALFGEAAAAHERAAETRSRWKSLAIDGAAG